jgi:BolA protein
MKANQRVAAIEARLNEVLSPESLTVEDESHLHAGHEGARDGRGHFRVTVVAACFEGQSMIKRHRMVYQAMGEWMQTDIHALSIEAWSSDDL